MLPISNLIVNVVQRKASASREHYDAMKFDVKKNPEDMVAAICGVIFFGVGSSFLLFLWLSR